MNGGIVIFAKNGKRMELKDIKHYFFARRNGITADVLRRGGSGFEMIFGCDVPGISALARQIGYDRKLAGKLWEDRKVRESHLLAAWLIDPKSVSVEECVEMAGGVVDIEDAQMLAFRLLKRHAQVAQILERLPHDSLAAQALRLHLQDAR